MENRTRNLFILRPFYWRELEDHYKSFPSRPPRFF
jgi:hypothetical protein